MTNAALGECRPEQMAFVGRTVVCHDVLDSDAVPREEEERALEDGYRARLLLVRQHLGVGKPGGVIDGDVKCFPSKAFTASSAIALALPIAGDAMTDAVDPAQFLGVEMDQLARMFALIADYRLDRIERLEATKADARPCPPWTSAGKAGGRSQVL